MQLAWLLAPVEQTLEAKKYIELSNQFKGKQWFEYSKEYKIELKSKGWLVWVFLWMFIGLFTSQWVVFLAIFIFNLLIVPPITKLTRFSMAYTIIGWLKSAINLALVLFVIVNHYHLKIDLTKTISI